MALPPKHKKRLIQGIAAYVLAVAAVAGWVYLHAGETVKSWEGRHPQTSAALAKASTETETDSSAVAPVADNAPAITVILTNAGMSADNTARAMEELPPQVALAFSPYPSATKMLIKKAQQENRNTLILVPMEPAAYPKDDPGPKSLLTRLSVEENQKSLNWALAQGSGAIGAMNYMGSRFLTDDKNLLPVFAAIKSKNLFFIEDSTLPTMGTAMAAAAANMPYMAADISLDDTPNETAIRQQLIELERRAAEKGFAVGIMHPYPVSISTIRAWASTLDNRGIRLVTLTDMMKLSAEHEQKQRSGQADTP